MCGKYTGCALFAFLTAVAAGCGGGGGANPSVPSPNGNTGQPPPLPAPVYSGNTTAAPLSPFVAGNVVHFVFADVEFATSLTQNLINPFLSGPQTISQTQQGPLGGQVSLNGNVVTSTDAWVTEKLDNYTFQPQGASGDVTLNGTLLVEVSGSSIIYGYIDYRIQGAGIDVTLSGTAAEQTILGNPATNTDPATTINLNLGVENNNSDVDEKFQNFTVQSTLGPDLGGEMAVNFANYRTFSGRVFDSAVGYVDINTQGTEVYSSDPTQTVPLYGANVLVTGASNTSSLLVGPLNYYFFSVGISTQNNGTFDASARYDWDGFTADTTPAPVGNGPVAVADQATTSAVGVPITLDGRFSHSPNGDYLHMSWSLLFATPGSHPILTNADMPEATLTVDKPGDYMVLLTVSDGSQSSKDTVTVTISANSAAITSVPMFQSAIGGDVTGEVGTPVLLDGRASFSTQSVAEQPSYTWQLIAPAGSKATLSDASSPQPSFTPDVPGYYRVFLDPGDIDLNNNLDVQPLTVNVGVPIAFRPPVAFDGACNICQLFTVADINGDGNQDLVINTLTGSVYVYMNMGNGVFASPVDVKFPVGNQQSLYITTADLNGDGRPDIIASGVDTENRTAVFVSLQNPDGSFSTPVEYPYTPVAPTVSEIAVGHLFGSSTLSVITIDSNGNLYNFPVNSNGTLGAPTAMALLVGGGVNSLSAIDFNNDGITDLITNEVGPPLPGATAVLEGTSSGTFTLTVNPNPNAAGAADLYGDGKNELVTAGQTTLNVYSESGTSSVSYLLPFDDPVLDIFPSAIGFADLTGDGLSDIVVLQTGAGGDGGPQIFFQNSNHSFMSSGPWIVGGPVGQINGPLWVGDLNGDGAPDLVYESNRQTVIQFSYKP